MKKSIISNNFIKYSHMIKLKYILYYKVLGSFFLTKTKGLRSQWFNWLYSLKIVLKVLMGFRPFSDLPRPGLESKQLVKIYFSVNCAF